MTATASLTKHFVLTVETDETTADLVMAMVAALGFDTFETTPEGFTTSVTGAEEPDGLTEMLDALVDQQLISYQTKVIDGQNWNAIWEASIDPVLIAENCRVRAAFHEPDLSIAYDLVITPKMAFGTGHHATTAQIMRFMLNYDLTGLSVLDAGSGSGVLAILAEKLGATRLYAYDNDPWCYESMQENVAGNQCTKIEIGLGVIDTVEPGEPFHWVIANINRNILLAEMPAYDHYLKPGGLLILSGFHEQDIEVLLSKGKTLGLQYELHTLEQPWAMLVLRKP